jgi:hypothetical protein
MLTAWPLSVIVAAPEEGGSKKIAHGVSRGKT